MITIYTHELRGAVNTRKRHDDWLSAFINWLESRGESFGGVTTRDSDEVGVGVVKTVVELRKPKHNTVIGG